MQTRTFHVEDITCGHCAYTVRKALSRLDGVVKVQVDIPSKTVEVEAHELVAVARILTAFEEAGYPATAMGHGGGHVGNAKNEGACHV